MSIDRLVAELWCAEEQMSTQLLAYAPAGSRVDEMEAYAEYLRDLLNASLEYVLIGSLATGLSAYTLVRAVIAVT